MPCQFVTVLNSFGPVMRSHVVSFFWDTTSSLSKGSEDMPSLVLLVLVPTEIVFDDDGDNVDEKERGIEDGAVKALAHGRTVHDKRKIDARDVFISYSGMFIKGSVPVLY